MNPDIAAERFRRWGYLQADLDPLGRLEREPHAEMDELSGPEADRWRRIYCGPLAAEFGHIADPARRRWVADRMEAEPPAVDRERLVRRLAETELFERFLHGRFVATKRYSLEGCASLVPLLDAVLGASARRGVEVALLAMSHRGRLSVMTLVVGVPSAHVFAGFQDLDPRSVLGSGDLKYHVGATGMFEHEGRKLQVHLVSNPSHLEAVDPVILGRTRARQERLGLPEGRSRVLPVTLHGDAALAGQGIAAETLNLADLRGYSVGGTVHVVVNNLIGFTTEPRALHSSRFASSVVRRLEAPIFHVNGEDPEAVVRAGAIAADYRAEFGSDVVVDLIGYRRYGHSEVDDPTTTQPVLYRKIQQLPMAWESYGARIGLGGDARREMAQAIEAELARALEEGRAMERRPSLRKLPAYWDRYRGGRFEPELEADTAIPEPEAAEILRRLTEVPEGFRLHPRVEKPLMQRREMARGERPVDWSAAEALAFGSLLREGTLVRLTGQDSRRGTFNQRHAVLFDHESGEEHCPLRHLGENQARFDPYDSPLSEAAALGFEYGFSRDYPDALVCWEAQFGDFANGAQVILDQFVAAGEDKWGLLSGLVILLPHGFEGQGPEHSSARLERFLELAAEDNLQVCQPSTAVQYFHLLRRQARRRWRKPLVVLTPKGLLRSPDVASPLAEFAAGRFRPVLPDPDAAEPERLLFCSGRIAHRLRSAREERGGAPVAVIRIEQLYPFPDREVAEALRAHPRAEVVWVQEEPANMGAMRSVRPALQRLAGDRHVTTVRRSPSASPATGSAAAHGIEERALIDLAMRERGPAGRA